MEIAGHPAPRDPPESLADVARHGPRLGPVPRRPGPRRSATPMFIAPATAPTTRASERPRSRGSTNPASSKRRSANSSSPLTTCPMLLRSCSSVPRRGPSARCRPLPPSAAGRRESAEPRPGPATRVPGRAGSTDRCTRRSPGLVPPSPRASGSRGCTGRGPADRVLLDEKRLVAALEEMADTLVPPVEPLGVRRLQARHEPRKRDPSRAHGQVDVIRHQAERDQPKIELLPVMSKSLEILLPVHVIAKDGLLLVPAYHDVVHGPGSLQPRRPSHQAE